jgi:integrase-like protein
MTRHSYQQGYVSVAICKPLGVTFRIRYRVRTVDGKWKHKSELLYGVAGKKAARAVLNERLKVASNRKPEAKVLTLRVFVETYWKPYLERKQIKPSTRKGYDSVLNCHLLPEIGDLRLLDYTPMHVEELLRIKTKADLSPTTNSKCDRGPSGTFAAALEDELIFTFSGSTRT